jgi:hypothetical protein
MLFCSFSAFYFCGFHVRLLIFYMS